MFSCLLGNHCSCGSDLGRSGRLIFGVPVRSRFSSDQVGLFWVACSSSKESKVSRVSSDSSIAGLESSGTGFWVQGEFCTYYCHARSTDDAAPSTNLSLAQASDDLVKYCYRSIW